MEFIAFFRSRFAAARGPKVDQFAYGNFRENCGKQSCGPHASQPRRTIKVPQAFQCDFTVGIQPNKGKVFDQVRSFYPTNET